MHHGRTCEHCEKCLTENCADWQQKKRTDKLHPACRHSKRIRRGNASCRPRDVADNLSAAVAFTRPAIGCRSSIRRSQSHPQITQIAMNLEKRNRDESQNGEARGWLGFFRNCATRVVRKRWIEQSHARLLKNLEAFGASQYIAAERAIHFPISVIRVIRG